MGGACSTPHSHSHSKQVSQALNLDGSFTHSLPVDSVSLPEPVGHTSTNDQFDSLALSLSHSKQVSQALNLDGSFTHSLPVDSVSSPEPVGHTSTNDQFNSLALSRSHSKQVSQALNLDGSFTHSLPVDSVSLPEPVGHTSTNDQFDSLALSLSHSKQVSQALNLDGSFTHSLPVDSVSLPEPVGHTSTNDQFDSLALSLSHSKQVSQALNLDGSFTHSLPVNSVSSPEPVGHTSTNDQFDSLALSRSHSKQVSQALNLDGSFTHSLPVDSVSLPEPVGHTSTNDQFDSLALSRSHSKQVSQALNLDGSFTHSLPVDSVSLPEPVGHTSTNDQFDSLALSLSHSKQVSQALNLDGSFTHSLPVDSVSLPEPVGHTSTNDQFDSLALSRSHSKQVSQALNLDGSFTHSLPVDSVSSPEPVGHTSTNDQFDSLALSRSHSKQVSQALNLDGSFTHSLPVDSVSLPEPVGHTSTNDQFDSPSAKVYDLAHTHSDDLAHSPGLPVTSEQVGRSHSPSARKDTLDLPVDSDSSSFDQIGKSFSELAGNTEFLSTSTPGDQKDILCLHTKQVRSASPVKVQTDWSRTTRKRFALLQAASDPKQTKVTSYFELIGSVVKLVDKNVEIRRALQVVCEKESEDAASSSQFLNKLLLNAEKNSLKLPHQRRHDEVMKKFSTSLFIYSGPMAYEFLHRNLPTALPSLRTVQRIVHNEYHHLHEGDFRFDDLLAHLNSYKTAKVVSIGEDATRVISRVDYDSETNKLVGFVLPCDEKGIPIGDSFMAVSFESIEQAFRDGNKSKYAFVYMAKPLAPGVPAFCLSCSGTNNQFTRELVLKRWKHIHTECSKRGIFVLSFGADGDSREMSSMSFSMQIGLPSRSKLPEQYLDLPTLSIPAEWSWFSVGKPTQVAYVQDVVHVAVKLKSKFMKPSHVLVMGGYIAGVHHLRMLQESLPKDQHGLREKDLNHKDKQNFDAVLHITSKSVLDLLKSFPDAKGTMIFLNLIRCVIDSYLDKQLDIYSRLKKAWYAVFFMRYWRQWLLLNPNCTLGDNFITPNAYKCIEINAHSLITFIITIRDKLPANSQCFYPWMLGSQSCEKAFRAVRSMSSTYSTILNFGMLGLLRRLHRMQIQFSLESEADVTGISYPNVSKHKVKDGMNNTQCVSECLLSNTRIAEAVEDGKKEAQFH